jgi:hypothetical protein
MEYVIQRQLLVFAICYSTVSDLIESEKIPSTERCRQPVLESAVRFSELTVKGYGREEGEALRYGRKLVSASAPNVVGL